MAALLPERPQRGGQPQHGGPVTGLVCPAERGPQVVVLGVQPRQPGDRLRPGQCRAGLLGQRQVVGGVPPPDLPGFGPLGQQLGAVFPDGLQHGQPRRGRRGVIASGRGCHRRPEQAAAHERCHQVQDGRVFAAVRTDCFRRFQRAAAHEHTQPPEQRLLRLVQQVIAPGDRVSHGLLPGRQVVRAAGQHRQPAVQPGQQRRRGKQPHPGRGQLNGQREPVQPPADLRHGRCRLGVQRQRRPHSTWPLHQQFHRWRVPQRFGRAGRGGQHQRRDRVVAPAPHVQGHPAGDQDDQLRARLQQGEHRIPGREQVLEVIQQHQQPPAPQRHRQQVGQRGRVPLIHPQPPGDGAQHQTGVAQRRQIDEDHTVGKPVPGRRGRLPRCVPPGEHQDRQARLRSLTPPRSECPCGRAALHRLARNAKPAPAASRSPRLRRSSAPRTPRRTHHPGCRSPCRHVRRAVRG